MSEQGADPLVQAATRLEAAVARLADVLGAALQRRAAPEPAEDGVPRAEVAALAEKLDSTITRLRGALAEEMRRAEDE